MLLSATQYVWVLLYASDVRPGVHLRACLITGATLQGIGREFGHRHHTTTLHSLRKIEEMRCSDSALDGAIRRVKDDMAQHLACISHPGDLWSL